VKFGGVGALQHHKEMLASTLFISMNFTVLWNVIFPFPFHDANIFVYNVVDAIWHTPKLFNGFKCESKMNTTEEWGVGLCSFACSTSRVEGCVKASG
jgi:hypothetical protein